MTPQQPKPPGGQKISLFYALFPDAETAAAISRLTQQLQAQHGLKGKALTDERFHVSLHWLGDYIGAVPEDVLAQAREAGAAAPAPAFDIAFDHVHSFSGKFTRPLILLSKEQNSALKDFNKALGQAMADVGLGQWVTKSFKPHLTLLYDKQGIPAEPITPVRWAVKDFVLVQSLIGKSHYDRLESWA